MKARVFVTLKQSILDPQGKTVQKAAVQMGYDSITSVRIGKLIELEFNDLNPQQSQQDLEELCRKLLSNPQIEDYKIEWVDESH